MIDRSKENHNIKNHELMWAKIEEKGGWGGLRFPINFLVCDI
jgi:hypothetical protein